MISGFVAYWQDFGHVESRAEKPMRFDSSPALSHNPLQAPQTEPPTPESGGSKEHPPSKAEQNAEMM